jgi:L-lactate dehydrogenase complex protein LldE
MRVSLFITCLVDQLYPNVGEAMVSTLRRLGVTVDFNPLQTCCGQVAFNSGYRPEARSMAEHFIEVFENERADFIVAPSGSSSGGRNFIASCSRSEDKAWRGDRVDPTTGRASFPSLSSRIGGQMPARFAAKVTYHDAPHRCASWHL